MKAKLKWTVSMNTILAVEKICENSLLVFYNGILIPRFWIIWYTKPLRSKTGFHTHCPLYFAFTLDVLPECQILRIHTRMSGHENTRVWMCARMRVCTGVCLCVLVCVCIHLFTSIRMFVHTHMYRCIAMYLNILEHIYT